jgi:hypothetical protein
MITPEPDVGVVRLAGRARRGMKHVHHGLLVAFITEQSVSHALKSSKYDAIVILVALHRQAALFVAIGPCQTDEVLLRFAEGQGRRR